MPDTDTNAPAPNEPAAPGIDATDAPNAQRPGESLEAVKSAAATQAAKAEADQEAAERAAFEALRGKTAPKADDKPAPKPQPKVPAKLGPTKVEVTKADAKAEGDGKAKPVEVTATAEQLKRADFWLYKRSPIPKSVIDKMTLAEKLEAAAQVEKTQEGIDRKFEQVKNRTPEPDDLDAANDEDDEGSELEEQPSSTPVAKSNTPPKLTEEEQDIVDSIVDADLREKAKARFLKAHADKATEQSKETAKAQTAIRERVMTAREMLSEEFPELKDRAVFLRVAGEADAFMQGQKPTRANIEAAMRKACLGNFAEARIERIRAEQSARSREAEALDGQLTSSSVGRDADSEVIKDPELAAYRAVKQGNGDDSKTSELFRKFTGGR